MAKKRFSAESTNIKNDNRKREAFSTQAEARDHSAAARARYNAVKKQLGNKTLADAAGEMVTKLRLLKRSDKARRLERYVRCHLNSVFGNRRLRTLDRPDLVTLAKKLRARFTSVRTYKAYAVALCEVLRFAFGSIEPPVKYPRDLYPMHQRAKAGSMGPQNNNKPIPYAREITDRLERATGILRIVLYLLIHAGLRIGEALALRRDDIELCDERGRAWINVRKNLRDDGLLGPPKTPAGKRRIPINSKLLVVLKTWLGETAGKSSDPLIGFKTEEGEFWTYKDMVRMHDSFQRSLGGRSFCLHRYRAAAVTCWLVAGIRISNIMRWIGHGSLRVTVTTYAGSIIFADDLWWELHPTGKWEKCPKESVRLSVVLGSGKSQKDFVSEGLLQAA
jgi:integrase